EDTGKCAALCVLDVLGGYAFLLEIKPSWETNSIKSNPGTDTPGSPGGAHHRTFMIVSRSTAAEFCRAIFSLGHRSISIVPRTPLRPTTAGTEIAALGAPEGPACRGEKGRMRRWSREMLWMTSAIDTPTANPAPPFFLITSAPLPRVRFSTSATSTGVTPGYLSSGRPPLCAFDPLGH